MLQLAHSISRPYQFRRGFRENSGESFRRVSQKINEKCENVKCRQRETEQKSLIRVAPAFANTVRYSTHPLDLATPRNGYYRAKHFANRSNIPILPSISTATNQNKSYSPSTSPQTSSPRNTSPIHSQTRLIDFLKRPNPRAPIPGRTREQSTRRSDRHRNHCDNDVSESTESKMKN